MLLQVLIIIFYHFRFFLFFLKVIVWFRGVQVVVFLNFFYYFHYYFIFSVTPIYPMNLKLLSCVKEENIGSIYTLLIVSWHWNKTWGYFWNSLLFGMDFLKLYRTSHRKIILLSGCGVSNACERWALSERIWELQGLEWEILLRKDIFLEWLRGFFHRWPYFSS